VLLSPVQITADCDHLFCLDCDATSLAECPVCQLPTLPRKHMVHLNQISTMLGLVDSLKKKLSHLCITANPITVIHDMPLNSSAGYQGADQVCNLNEISAVVDSVKAGMRQGPSKASSGPPTSTKAHAPCGAPISSGSPAFSEGSNLKQRRDRSRSTDDIILPSPKRSQKSLSEHLNSEDPSTPINSNMPTPGTRTSPSPTTPSPASRRRVISLRKKKTILERKRKEVNQNGETALHVAARRGQTDQVEITLKTGASPNTKDYANLTPLFDACSRGFVAIVELLLQAGAHPNTPCGDKNNTPLHEAIFHGNIKMIQVLLSSGANPHLLNTLGQTPMQLARHDEVKKFLVDKMKNIPSREDPILIGSQLLRRDSPILGGFHFGEGSGKPISGKVGSSITVPTAGTETRVITLTGLMDEDTMALIAKFAASFGVEIVETFTDAVTHVLAQCDADGNAGRTCKYLQGVIMGKKVVDVGWLSASLKVGKIEPEELFLVKGSTKNPCSEVPKKSLLNR